MVSLAESTLDFWLTTGRFAEEFERRFAEFMDVRHCRAGQLWFVGQLGRARHAHLA